MEYASIEREIHINAPPEVVFEVVSRPEHMREWWSDEAQFEPVAGSPGDLSWHASETAEAMSVAFTVIQVDPPRRFVFRWCYPENDRSGPSLLVTFDLEPADGGTRLRMTETGFREMGWDAAVLEASYRDHVEGWAHYIPVLGTYAATLVTAP